MEEKSLILPTSEQVQWADCELGVIIHFDMPVYARRGYNFREHMGDPLPASLFDPKHLDVDRWLCAAADMGAKYAVLVAKHCTGFCLWPTSCNDYCVKGSPWRGGKGDIVADFFASCKKYGLRPGLYYSVNCNQYYSADFSKGTLECDSMPTEKYVEVVLAQLRELWSSYGKVFEIWFDGGCLPADKGGDAVAALLNEMQPDAVVFQGPGSAKSLIRWVGNERGAAPQDCSSIFSFKSQNNDGTQECSDYGDTYGDTWCPAESDMPGRYAEGSSSGGWFWAEGEEKLVIPAQELFKAYLNSVGRNTNMLLGMVIDRDGRFPERDEREMRAFGRLLRERLGTPAASADCTGGAMSYKLSLERGARCSYIVVGEDIAKGERVTKYSLLADGREVCSGSIIGHKRIFEVSGSEFELRILDCKAQPAIKFFEAY